MIILSALSTGAQCHRPLTSISTIKHTKCVLIISVVSQYATTAFLSVQGEVDIASNCKLCFQPAVGFLLITFCTSDRSRSKDVHVGSRWPLNILLPMVDRIVNRRSKEEKWNLDLSRLGIDALHVIWRSARKTAARPSRIRGVKTPLLRTVPRRFV
jgi:hypothetical protein